MKSIMVESLVSRETGEARVNVFWREGTKPVQLSPTEARDLAFNLMRGAEGAETDACLLGFAEAHLGGKEAGSVLVSELRKYRG